MKPAVTCACRGLPGDGPSRRAACSPGARRVLKGGNRALRRSGQGPAPQRFHHLHIPSFLLCFRAVGRGGSQGRAWSGVRAASGRGGRWAQAECGLRGWSGEGLGVVSDVESRALATRRTRAARRSREGGGRAGGPGGRQPQATRTGRALGFDDFPLLVGNSH